VIDLAGVYFTQSALHGHYERQRAMGLGAMHVACTNGDTAVGEAARERAELHYSILGGLVVMIGCAEERVKLPMSTPAGFHDVRSAR
jgi:hypothetical protein